MTLDRPACYILGEARKGRIAMSVVRTGLSGALVLLLLACTSTGSVAQQVADPAPAAPVVAAAKAPEPARSNLTPAQRQEVYEAIWSTLNQEYPYFAELGLDWQAVKAQYDKELTKLKADDHAGFDLFVRRLLAEVKDSHTWLDYPMDEARRPGLRTVPAGDQILISEVTPGSDAEAAGFKVGMALEKVDEVPIERAWSELASLISASSPHRATWGAAKAILNGLPETTVLVTARGADGKRVRATLGRTYSPAPGVAPFQRSTLEGGIAYMRIGSFDRPNVRTQFLSAMTEIAAAQPPGVIIDLRGNGGGNQFWALDLIDAMVNQSQMAGYVEEVRDGSFREMVTNPWATPYTGPVYLLTDPGCMSACDFFATFFDRTGRGELIGEPTAGATHEGSSQEMPHGFFLHYGGPHRLHGPEKVEIERHPAQVDYRVTVTPADLIAGRDPVLAKALELLGH